MLEILKQLYLTKDRRRLYHISANSALAAWIDTMCNSELLSGDCPENNLLHIKIQTILHPGNAIKCENGNWLRYSVTSNKFYCVRTCSCWQKTAQSRQRDTMLEKYGYASSFQVPEIKEKIKSGMQERYGVNHVSQRVDVKECKRISTHEKYGVDNILSARPIKDKIRNTLLERYGTDVVAHIPGIQEKKEQTCHEKYGVSVLARIPGVQETRETTCTARYGVSTMLKVPDIQQTSRPTRIKNNMMKYGVKHPRMMVMSEFAKKVLSSADSLKEMLLTHGFDETIKLLGVAASTVYKYHSDYALNLLIPASSAAEKELSNWLTSLDIAHECNNRIVCRPQEIDIYIPEFKLAIEFDGLYWHSETHKNKHYHLNKTKKCAEQGIQLIHIFEDEWTNKKEICKGIIAARLGKNTVIIDGNTCEVREINNEMAKNFLDDNHLLGNSRGGINLALYHDNEIQMCMTFTDGNKKKIQWELTRMATKINTAIKDGAIKLWEHFHKTYKPKSIISYCDVRWDIGNMHAALGFTQLMVGKPTYWYTDYVNRYRQCIKSTLTEDDKILARNILRLNKIWDCGEESWLWEKV